MKIKYISYLLASCMFLSTSQAFAMEEREDKEGSTVQVASLSFEEQLERVSKFVAQRKEANQPVKMVFGATNNEGNRFSDEGWIFFDSGDGGPHDPQGRPYIQADFNKLDQLSATMKAIGPSLRMILLDDSTYKFTQWTKEMVEIFGSLLDEEGPFILCPHTSYMIDIERTLSDEDQIRAAFHTLNTDRFQGKIFPTMSMLPSIILAPTDEYLNLPEVEEEANKIIASYEPFKPLLDLEDSEFYDKAEELGLDTFLPPELIKEQLDNPDSLKTDIATRIKSKKMENEFYHKYFVPHIESRLQECFKDVKVERGVPFPVPSNWGGESAGYTIISCRGLKEE